jgi:hypothetical protein
MSSYSYYNSYYPSQYGASSYGASPYGSSYGSYGSNYGASPYGGYQQQSYYPQQQGGGYGMDNYAPSYQPPPAPEPTPSIGGGGGGGGMSLQELLGQAGLGGQPGGMPGFGPQEGPPPKQESSGGLFSKALGIGKYLIAALAGYFVGNKVFGGNKGGDSAAEGLPTASIDFVKKGDRSLVYGVYKEADAGNDEAQPDKFVAVTNNRFVEVPKGDLEKIEAEPEAEAEGGNSH